MHLTTEQKLDSLLDLCNKLSYEQRIVFSDEGNLTARHKIVGPPGQPIAEKPKGLWYSFGAAWPSYLFDEDEAWSNKRLAHITHIYELFLDFNKLCRLTDKKDFDEFEQQVSRKKKSCINWEKVAERWCGIDVKFCRDKTVFGKNWSEWYSGWDVSSGCIWDRDAVIGIKLLKSWTPTWLETCP